MIVNKKTFIITGASSGIGEQLSKNLAQKGAQVVCAARRKEELDRVCQAIESAGGSALAVQTDITALEQCRTLIQDTVAAYGRIDGLILNAGISMWARFEEITDIEFFHELMNTNYMGAVNCCHAALPYLKKTRGKIVSCSTAQALMGFPNHSGYVASKHALHGFLATLSMELKGEITILEAVLSWIRGTNLRSNAFGSDAKPKEESSRKHTQESVSLEECVEEIIHAIEKDKSTVYIPNKLRLIPFLNVFFKQYLERKVNSAINDNEKG
ncbi:MAG: SDR family oxidoreductase [Candidatus Marinimicrobia bacterium]|nr:SDR family oxidoreductase [Candidatus Neomarinimicrobiota bacterium]